MLGHPPGFLPRPPPGLNTVDQTQVVTQAVVGEVQAMLSRFEETFKRRLAQVEARAPRERSMSPLYSSASNERSEDFSSQEESLAGTEGRMASVVHALSPGTVQVNRKIALSKDGDNDILTIHLSVGEEPSSSQTTSPGPLAP